MDPIAFTLFSFPIHWYGVCIAAGFLLSTGLMLLIRKHAGLSSDHVFDIAMISIFCGLIGARLWHVIEYWNEDFAGKPLITILQIYKGGIVFYGGFVCAFTAVCIYAVRKKLDMLRVLDIMAPAIALAHAFGRVGCFIQGCCFGKPAGCSGWWTVVYPVKSGPFSRFPAMVMKNGEPFLQSQPLYPVQLMESLMNLILCGVLLLILRKTKIPGRVAGIYLCSYAAIRFCLEFFRGDFTPKEHYLFTMTSAQMLALFLMFPLGLVILFYPQIVRRMKESAMQERKK